MNDCMFYRQKVETIDSILRHLLLSNRLHFLIVH